MIVGATFAFRATDHSLSACGCIARAASGNILSLAISRPAPGGVVGLPRGCPGEDLHAMVDRLTMRSFFSG